MAIAKTTKDSVPGYNTKAELRKARRGRVMGMSSKKFAELNAAQKTKLLKACAIKLGLIQDDD